MTTPLEPKPMAKHPHPNAKSATNARPPGPQFRNTKSSRSRHPSAMPPQNAQRNYERYLALAQAEALSGDRIAAENYLQYAEHYLRSMRESRATAGSTDAS